MFAMTIFGEMPKRQRLLHQGATLLIGIICLGFTVFGARMFLLDSAAGRGVKGDLIMMLWFMFLAVVLIGAQRQYHGRLITEFTCDGRFIRFKTLGHRETQTRTLSSIVQIRVERSRYGRSGYRLIFRDSALVYLEDGVSNVASLAGQLGAKD
jgi:hypothetical protein